ncbi:MAG: ferrous iron transporter B [Candidatus Sumerlaeota bacterium]|nr:ferrous iron transporter B [Candidatus Sumerlaeota bacterium]
MRLVLIGNPNVGKSALFNRLTGVHVVASNYPGTTVEITRGTMCAADQQIEVVDFPGIYSLEPSCKAEEVAATELRKLAPNDIILNVVDSTNLERNLGLTLQLTNLRKPMLIALNFWDEAEHTGVKVDASALEKIFGVPCVPVVGTTGQGTRTLAERIRQAAKPTRPYRLEDRRKWEEVGAILGMVQTLSPRRHTLGEWLGDASLKPFSGALIAILVMGLSFGTVRWVGEGLASHIFEPFFERVWSPLMLKLSGVLGSGWLQHLVIGTITDGQIFYGESFGLLTTGLFVTFAAVLPYIFAFYLVLSILEDSGYLPRLAVLTDRLMHNVGLHGMAVLPMLLGLGCNVPGVLASRIVESDRERFICITLTTIAVPCMAQTAMIIGLAGRHGPSALCIIFSALFAIWFVLGVVLNRFLKGESPEILMEVPPFRMPHFRSVLKKIWMRLVWFLREAVPFVLGGVLLANVLYSVGVIDVIGRLAAPVVSGVMGLPKEAVGGLLIGFLRKDVAVGMLAPLHLSFRQTIVACVVLAVYFPCVAAFTIMLRELGAARMLVATAIMGTIAVLAGGMLNLILWA